MANDNKNDFEIDSIGDTSLIDDVLGADDNDDLSFISDAVSTDDLDLNDLPEVGDMAIDDALSMPEESVSEIDEPVDEAEVALEPAVDEAEVTPEPVVEAEVTPEPVVEAKPEEPTYGKKRLQSLRLNLNWYSGLLSDKVFEVAADNMPEFLDPYKDIKVIHVTVSSGYGWNVFFDNGVFMNLLDLKEYQERNASLPSPDGKIICGNKTTSFENIERIVVFEKPRYFSYVPEE